MAIVRVIPKGSSSAPVSPDLFDSLFIMTLYNKDLLEERTDMERRGNMESRREMSRIGERRDGEEKRGEDRRVKERTGEKKRDGGKIGRAHV